VVVAAEGTEADTPEPRLAEPDGTVPPAEPLKVPSVAEEPAAGVEAADDAVEPESEEPPPFMFIMKKTATIKASPPRTAI
jgi:hypothetical protein